MRILVIAEGSAKWDRFIKRWGVSFIIGENVLFDTFGDKDIFLENARKFGVDFSKVEHIIISHEHWDHISGLPCVLEKNKNVFVYVCGGFSKDFKDKIKSYGAKVIENSGWREIVKGIYISGEFLGKYKEEIIYEQAVCVKTDKGLSLITGCAHPGIVNMAVNAEDYFKEDITFLAGGFHLKEKTTNEIKEIIKKLKEMGVNSVAPMHCTGKAVSLELKQEYKEDFIELKEGSFIDI